MSLHDKTFLQPEEEFFSEDTKKYGFSYSQCSSFEPEPLDLSMKPWFDDGIEHPFRESVSFTILSYFLKYL